MPRIQVVAILLLAAGCAAAHEPVIGGPCEGCELVFVGMPEEIGPVARIAPTAESGEPMVLEGTVTERAGRPVPGVIVYAYHTDAAGVYPSASTRHGRLRGWVRSDQDGDYRFDSIRPGPYPGRTTPAHVHLHVIEPGRATYWIDSVEFSDDPLLPEASRRPDPSARGGPGVVTPTRDAEGVWHVRRDIVLGHSIPGYAESGGPAE